MGRHRKTLLWMGLALGPLLAGGVALLSLIAPPEDVDEVVMIEGPESDTTQSIEAPITTVIVTVLEARTVIEAGTIIRKHHVRERETERELEGARDRPVTGEEGGEPGLPTTINDGGGIEGGETPGNTREQVIGSVAQTTIAAGEEITEDQIVPAGRPGYLTAAISPGNRAIAVRVGEATARAGLVNTGDRVDVILSAEVRTLMGERERYAQTIVHNARVIGIDHNPGRRANASESEDEVTEPLTTVTLEASRDDVQRLAAAEHEGSLEIALRSERETSQTAREENQATRLRSVIVPSDLVRLDDARVEAGRRVAQSEARAAIARNEREAGSGGRGGTTVRIARGGEAIVEQVFSPTEK